MRFVNKIEDATQAERQVAALLGMDYSIHYHVWTQAERLELLAVLRAEFKVHFDVELSLKNGDECTFILRKEMAGPATGPGAE